jgi:hypothetical protein
VEGFLQRMLGRAQQGKAAAWPMKPSASGYNDVEGLAEIWKEPFDDVLVSGRG